MLGCERGGGSGKGGEGGMYMLRSVKAFPGIKWGVTAANELIS